MVPMGSILGNSFVGPNAAALAMTMPHHQLAAATAGSSPMPPGPNAGPGLLGAGPTLLHSPWAPFGTSTAPNGAQTAKTLGPRGGGGDWGNGDMDYRTGAS
jgi:hypothetical protein